MPPETPPRPNLNTIGSSRINFSLVNIRETKTRSKHVRRSTTSSTSASTFVDLSESGELVSYDSILSEEALRANVTVTYDRFPIPDLSVPQSAADLGEVLLTIDRRIREGGRRFSTLLGRSWSHRSGGRMLVARARPNTGRRIGRTAPEMEHG
ncbi:MAG: hypothetical protein JO151_08105 [Verrucomicrobia bacterium]|nr:hypothetical protein [Verrucomicrobiota bacterium]